MVLFFCCFIAQLIENNSNVSHLVQLPKRDLKFTNKSFTVNVTVAPNVSIYIFFQCN